MLARRVLPCVIVVMLALWYCLCGVEGSETHVILVLGSNGLDELFRAHVELASIVALGIGDKDGAVWGGKAGRLLDAEQAVLDRLANGGGGGTHSWSV